MRFRRASILPLVFFALSHIAAPRAQASPAAELVSPSEFAGFPIGADGKLVRWENIVPYFELAAAKSDRVLLDKLGNTTGGNPFILAVISSPQNLGRLDSIRAAQRRFAYPRDFTEAEASDLASTSPAVVLMTCNIHSTEIASSQMALEVVHRMATEESPWMREVLENVVFLLVPSLNPDGQIIVTDWNDRVRDTKHVWSALPWLYHPYAGHDNNRDSFMMTQVESRYLNKLLFQDWFPQVYLDQHQQGNAGMRAFVPPFRNPINPNVDPVIWGEIGMIGMAIFTGLHEAGFSGVAYDQTYTGWWQGGFLRGAWFHNMAGLLTEVASANLASPVYQQQAGVGNVPNTSYTRDDWEKKRADDPAAPSPPPQDVTPRNNYPRPWLGGKWTLRDIIDYERVITDNLLESAAKNRRRLIENQIKLGQKAIAQGRLGQPYAYLFPPGQHDPGAQTRLLEVLHFAGVEVHRAGREFTAGGERYPQGTVVVLMAQPFRAYAKDLLEPQEHPNPEDLPLGAMSDQPYDVTAWTLPLQMGVKTVKIEEPFDADLELLEKIERPRGEFVSHGRARHGVLIHPQPNNKSLATNRLLRAGARVAWLTSPTETSGSLYPPGTLWVRGLPTEKIRSLVEDLGLRGVAIDEEPTVPALQLAVPRVALYQPWTASMDEGWTRWLLEHYEFPFTNIRNPDVQAGRLWQKWDAIVLPGDRGYQSILEGEQSKSAPEEYRGGIGARGRQALREFVVNGGTLVTMGDSTEFALRSFELPLKSALSGAAAGKFSCPGSFLRIDLDPGQPIAYGMPSEATAVFADNDAFEPSSGFRFTRLDVIARYPGSDLLQSGWIRGPEHLYHRIAAASVDYQRGHVVLLGFRPQFRAQPDNTFKLLFNAIHLAGAEPAKGTSPE